MLERHVTATAKNCLRLTVRHTVKTPTAHSGWWLSMQEQNDDEIRMARVILGRRLREIRKIRGHSADKVSQLIRERFDYSFDSTTITKIETAESRPNIDFLLIVRDIYEIEIGELFGGQMRRFGWLLDDTSFFRRLERLERLYGNEMRDLIRVLFDFMSEFASILKRAGEKENG